MATSEVFDIDEYLGENDQEDAETIDAIVDDIRSALADRPGVQKLMKNKLKVRGENEAKRLELILKYTGPDDDTLHCLELHRQQWLANPMSFWKRSVALDFSPCHPMVQIIGNYLYTEMDESFEEEHRDMLLLGTEMRLYLNGIVPRKHKDYEKLLKRMRDAGSRYRNLEYQLGLGASLVYGKSIGDTTWSKVIPKKDGKFAQVVDHLKEIGIPRRAEQYREVECRVIEAQLYHLQQSVNYWRPLIAQHPTSPVGP